jgi:hypothetical protein
MISGGAWTGHHRRLWHPFRRERHARQPAPLQRAGRYRQRRAQRHFSLVFPTWVSLVGITLIQLNYVLAPRIPFLDRF